MSSADDEGAPRVWIPALKGGFRQWVLAEEYDAVIKERDAASARVRELEALVAALQVKP